MTSKIYVVDLGETEMMTNMATGGPARNKYSKRYTRTFVTIPEDEIVELLSYFHDE